MISAFLLSAVLTFIIHWPMILHDPLTTRDDNVLIGPLFKISTFKQYWAALRSGVVVDFQPLRDLSFWLDIHATILLGFGVFHLVNVLVWIACLAVSARIFKKEIKNPALAAGCLVLLAVHPAIANSVAWVSARKHLLACLFALITTDVILTHAVDRPSGSRKGFVKWGAPASLLLSLLAQPLQIFLPLWIALKGILEKKLILVRTAVACLPIVAAIAVINYWYYNSAGYRAVSAVSKFLVSDNFTESLGIPILELGRYFFQLCAPFWVAVDYYPGSVQNVIGVVILPLFAWLCLKRIEWRLAASWLFFTFLPVVWISAAHTNIFVSDSYLLLPATGFFVLVGRLIEPLAGVSRSSRVVSLYFCVFAIFVATATYLSRQQSLIWRSDDAMWEQTYKVSRTPHSVAYIGTRLIDKKKFDEAYALANDMLAWGSDSPSVAFFYGKAVYFNPKLSIDEKLKLYEKAQQIGLWPTYFASVLFAQKGEFAKAYQLSQTVLLEPPGSFAGFYEYAVAESYTYCLRAKLNVNCDEVVKNLRSRDDRWSEADFKFRQEALKHAVYSPISLQ